MNARPLKILTLVALSLISTFVQASVFNNDPEVVYMEELSIGKIELLTLQRTLVYDGKQAKRALGAYPTDTKLELLAIGKHAYKVRGRATHGTVAGWVNPKVLASKDKDFIANLKTTYERQLVVKELISNQEVAIGMTLQEVSQALGEPTETEVKQTREGNTGEWSYIVTEEEKHYRLVIHPHTGQTFRQLSHVTTEEKSRTTVGFKNNVVATISRKENNGAGKVNVVPIPVHYTY